MGYNVGPHYDSYKQIQLYGKGGNLAILCQYNYINSRKLCLVAQTRTPPWGLRGSAQTSNRCPSLTSLTQPFFSCCPMSSSHHRTGQLRIGRGTQAAAHGPNAQRQHHRGPGLLRRHAARQREDAGAHGGGHGQRDQIRQAIGTRSACPQLEPCPCWRSGPRSQAGLHAAT